MTTKTKAKSRILEAVHETAADLHRLGFIDQQEQQVAVIFQHLHHLADSEPHLLGPSGGGLVIAVTVATATATTAVSYFHYFSPLAGAHEFQWHHPSSFCSYQNFSTSPYSTDKSVSGSVSPTLTPALISRCSLIS